MRGHCKHRVQIKTLPKAVVDCKHAPVLKGCLTEINRNHTGGVQIETHPPPHHPEAAVRHERTCASGWGGSLHSATRLAMRRPLTGRARRGQLPDGAVHHPLRDGEAAGVDTESAIQRRAAGPRAQPQPWPREGAGLTICIPDVNTHRQEDAGFCSLKLGCRASNRASVNPAKNEVIKRASDEWVASQNVNDAPK